MRPLHLVRQGDRRVIPATVLILSSVLACRQPISSPPAPAIERFVEHPARLRFARAAPPPGDQASPAPSRYHWSAAEIQMQWRRSVAQGELVLRSPRLQLAGVDDIAFVRVRFSEIAGVSRFSLVWTGQPAASPADLLSHRREVRVGDPPSKDFLIGGDDFVGLELQGPEPTATPFDYLSLRFPRGSASVALESVEIVSLSDVFRGRAAGLVRHVSGGEIRDALYARTPATVEY